MQLALSAAVPSHLVRWLWLPAGVLALVPLLVVSVPPQYSAIKLLQGDNPLKTPSAEALATTLSAIRRVRSPATAVPEFLLLSYPARLHDALPAGLTPVAAGPDFLLLRID